MNKYEIIYQEKNKKLKKILEIKGQLDNSYLPKNLISIRRKTKEVKTFKDEIVINILNELNLILH